MARKHIGKDLHWVAAQLIGYAYKFEQVNAALAIFDV